MMPLSTRAKEAIKTALAMTIVYGIALSMDWPNPHWAGFAVAVISLSTVGQSLNKGVMRMFGTLLAAAFSLTMIALLPQDRWWFFLVLSAFVGFCTYRMGGSKHQYFWHVAGFVSLIICLGSVPDTDNAFTVAVLRILETGLGILVYTLVTVLLWPTDTRDELDAAVSRLATTQRELYGRYRKLLHGEGQADDTHSLRMQEVQQFNQFNQALEAARTDSYEVWEVRQQWQQVQAQTAEIMQTLERWRESFAGTQDLVIRDLLPDLDDLGEELDGRFEQIERLFLGEPPERFPQVVELPWDKEAVRSLNHFQKAALAVTRSRLQHLEAVTRALFDTLADIKGFGEKSVPPIDSAVPQSQFLFDPDRMAAAVSVAAGLWLAYLIWIYTEIPGGTAFVIMVGPFGMALANMPQVPVLAVFRPAAFSVVFASVLYIFVMPQLSSFAGLGTLIFAVTFTICYLFHTPKQGLGKVFGLAIFVLISDISNQQSYSFLSMANTALMFPLVFALLGLSANIPFSARPEKAFLRLQGRFFNSCTYLLSTMGWGLTTTPTRLDRWWKAFHMREIAALPQKLATWGKAVDTNVLSGTTPQQVQALTTNLQSLTYRMQELLDAQTSSHAKLLVRELLVDVRAWRLKVTEIFQAWSQGLATAPADALREGFTARLARLEWRLAETMNMAAEGELSDQDKEHLYRLLGAYRSLSEEGLEYARTAESIDWRHWRESRF